MDAVALKAALLRADVTQAELAARLHRTRGVVAGWVASDRVPEEWVDLVYEALGLTPPPPPLAAYESIDLLQELVDRERRALRQPDYPEASESHGQDTNSTDNATRHADSGNNAGPAQAHSAEGPRI